ncbi:molybdopterin-dependent oxidoreductase [Conexivisphaera calida]|uniref:Anaerobic dehydrogenases, typically selenocysteine-containing n=1 Tax=Conexivisphaera calida TaxID=1874277 RepID=A0A4V0P1L1_9ARCH|nr:molybdopterin-dependent oxidoreductase [Conexivisphaera calida]BBE42100.1 Anaerobic dehydrogenases, typically selenocysteine-containing [Conexivisphaera calida]
MIICTRDCYDGCIFDSGYSPARSAPTLGFTCSRGRSDLPRNGVNRVESALVDGKEVDVAEAIRRAARAMRAEVDRDPGGILHLNYDGNQGLLTWYYPARLFTAMGASRTDYSICSAEGHAAIGAHYGTSAGALPEEFPGYGAVVLWAFPASVSAPHIWRSISRAEKVSIDVRISDTSRRSRRAIVVRPGSDVFLAMGVIRALLEEGLATGEVSHVRELEEFVMAHTMEELSSAAGVREDEVRWLARFYAEERPLTLIGFALGRSPNGGDAISLISLIPALVGLRRGFYYSNSMGLGIDFNYLRGYHMGGGSRVVGMAHLREELESGRIRLVYAWNMNPVVTMPGGPSILEAVEEGRISLIAHDPFLSETARAADIVLPAPTFLEKEDVGYSYWHDYLVFNEPVAPPRGVPEPDAVRAIAREAGISHPLLEEDPWRAVEVAIRGTGVTLDELRSRGAVRVRNYPPPSPRDGELLLVFTSHPLYTNTQFREVHGRPEPIVHTHDVDGEVVLETDLGSARVIAVADPGTPPGVAWMYKSALVDLDGRSINGLLGGVAGPYAGTPVLNGVAVRLRRSGRRGRGEGEPRRPGDPPEGS